MANIGYIYKIINKINSKVYIGQTARTIEIRWQEHIKSAKYDYRADYDTKIHRAMRKYGIKNFSIKKIEECPIEQLHCRERYWINYYNSIYNGYNISFGGEGNQKYSPEEVLELWYRGMNGKEICNILGTNYTTLSEILNSFGISSQERINRGFDVKVGIDKSTILEDFNLGLSINRIVKKYGISDTQVKRVLLEFGITKQQFSENSIKGHSTSGSPCAIEQYNLSKQKIGEFSSIKEAKAFLGKKPNNSALNKRLKHDNDYHFYDGFYWRYVE